jgi:putative membrane protein
MADESTPKRPRHGAPPAGGYAPGAGLPPQPNAHEQADPSQQGQWQNQWQQPGQSNGQPGQQFPPQPNQWQAQYQQQPPQRQQPNPQPNQQVHGRQSPPQPPQQFAQPQSQGQPPHGQQPQPHPGQRPNQQFPGQQPGQQFQGHPGPQPNQQYPGQHPGQQFPNQQQNPQQQLPQQQRAALADLADGDWHRLHKLSMWNAILGTLFAFFWALFALGSSLFVGVMEGDLPGWVLAIVLVGVVVLLGLVIVWVVLDYRNTSFRLTSEVFELRKGVLNKQNRQVRFDRLQSVNLNRPMIARMFNLTALETSGAGDKSGLSLKFLDKDQANALRAEILRRASGAKRRKSEQARALAEQQAGGAPAQAQPPAPGQPAAQQGAPGQQPQPGQPTQPAPPRRSSLSSFVDRAVDDFTAPELSAEQVAEQSIVRVKPGRVAATTAFGGLISAAVMLVIGAIAYVIVRLILAAALRRGVPMEFDIIWWIVLLGTIGVIIFATLLGAAATAVGNMQYTIAGTPDGLRIGRGILSQTNDTLPPGRIHSIDVRQPLLWRPFKWFQIRVNRADVRHGTTSEEQQQALQRNIVLPVGTRDEVERVLQLVLPMHMNARTAQLIDSGFKSGRRPEFTPAPGRSWWLHPFSWRFIGGAIDGGLVYIRTGWLTRSVAMVPGERIQSVTAKNSLLERAARVAHIRIDTVNGPITPRLPAVSNEYVNGLHEELSKLAVRAAKDDTSHRWYEAQARATVAAARMQLEDARRTGRPLDPQSQRVLAAEEAWRREQQQQSQQQQQQPQQQPPSQTQ